MLKPLATLSAFALSLPALAEDFVTTAPVRAVTVHPNGATLTREIALDLPAGTHRVLIPARSDGAFTPPRLTGTGNAVIGTLEFLGDFVADPETLYSDAQRAAQAAFEVAQDDLQRAEDEMIATRATLAASEAQIGFLRSITYGAPDQINPDAIAATAQLIGRELAGALTAKADAEVEIRELSEIRDAAAEALEAARRERDRLRPPEGPLDMLAINLRLDAPGPVALQIEDVTPAAFWRPDYDLRLETGAVPALTIARKVIVGQSTQELWQDVALTLSTSDPFAQQIPTPPQPNRAEISNINPRVRAASPQEAPLATQSLARAPSALSDEAAIVEEVASVAFDGLSITYKYPTPVTLAPGEEAVVLTLDELDWAVDLFNRALPRYDQTGFLIARITNTQSEPSLPGEAAIYRDGGFIGRQVLPMIPAGGEEEISFGALNAIQLEYRLLDNDTGDTGLITTSNTRRQQMEFNVSNLSTEPETVETLFALPFSEQEDLNISLETVPDPDERDFDKLRNVGKWLLDLAPGETQTVRIEVDLSWPEGQQLFWQP